MNLVDKIRNLPDSPGIYLFYNSKKELVYVGKATSLKRRVASYFKGSFDSARGASLRMTASRPIERMIDEVKNIKTITTDSVLEAVILEANTIKKFQPKYNVDLKDDKSWNYLVITRDEYSKVLTIRQHELNNLKLKIKNFKFVFGPYPGLKTREMMKILNKLFYISTCTPPVRHVERRPKAGVETSRRSKGSFTSVQDDVKPCFYYQLGQCLGVCTGEITSGEYKKKVIKPLVEFLRGNKKSLLKNLIKEMKRASTSHEFEEAGRLRDQINNLQKIQDIALLNKSFVENNLELNNNSQFRIEGYDISNLGSSGKVGSMVVFENNEPNKNQYRKFKIKNVLGQSDVDCLAEVLTRRLKHHEWLLPQVILVDGGLPQVNKVVSVVRLRKFKIPVVGIAKGPERKRNDFIIGFKDQEFIKWVDKNKEILIKVRDEAHRFAITYQKSLRKI